MRVLAIFSASYALAVLAAVYGELGALLLPLGGVCAVAAVCAALLRKRLGRRGTVALLCAAGLGAGFWWTAGYQALFLSPARALDGQTIRLTARVLQWPQETDWGYSVLVLADIPQGGYADTLLYTDEQGAALRPGDRIETVARLNFADHSASGEQITYYTSKGIRLWGRAYGALSCSRPGRPGLRALPALLSRALEDSIRAAFPEGVGEQVLAIVTGNRTNLSQPFTSSLRRAGLSHTAAVSGMHLAFLAGAFALILGRHRRSTSLIVIPLSLMFMLVAGCTPSVVRATVMVVLLMAAPLVGRERDDFTSLGAALLVLLVQNPMAVTHVGLQLSFAAVAGIFLISEPIQNWLKRTLRFRYARPWTWRWLPNLVLNYIISTLSATLGALVFTMPLSALHFSSVSLLAPVSNLLTLWAVAVVFGGGLAVGFLGLAFPNAAQAAACAVAPFAQYIEKTAGFLSRIPLAAITMESFSYKVWMVLFSAALFAALWRRKRRDLFPLACFGVVTLAAAVLLTSLEFGTGSIRVTALDVGQGQCVLIRQGGHLTVVDCGGNGYENAGDLAADHIQNTGRGRIDLLVLTHFHEDHANGVLQLLRRMEVSVIAMPDVDQESQLRREILDLAGELGIECRMIREDVVLELDSQSSLTLCAPLGSSDINERGLTVLATTGDFDVLITGDMGEEVEPLLLEHLELPDVELLVVGHHGSKYATTGALLRRIRPELAFISAGKNNYYGHPAAETLERLEQAGAEVYRTDLQGSLTVWAGA